MKNLILITATLFLITACSNAYKKPLPSSGVKMKDVASESYETLKVSVKELKTAFFP